MTPNFVDAHQTRASNTGTLIKQVRLVCRHHTLTLELKETPGEKILFQGQSTSTPKMKTPMATAKHAVSHPIRYFQKVPRRLLPRDLCKRTQVPATTCLDAQAASSSACFPSISSSSSLSSSSQSSSHQDHCALPWQPRRTLHLLGSPAQARG